jgi:hypothetical protein
LWRLIQRDGFADLAVANYSGDSVSVFRGNGTFQPGMVRKGRNLEAER